MQLPETKQSICPVVHGLCTTTLLALFLFALNCVEAKAGGMVRLTDKKKNSIEGKIVSITKSSCSIMDRLGRIHHQPVSKLESLRKIGTRFEAHSTAAFRQNLISEFKGDYEVAGATHYLVCAPKGRASQYAKLFESIYRDVERFYHTRGFRVTRPEVPLVAIVFRSQAEFAQYCRRDDVQPSRTLMGYYSPLSNRVALFDDARLLTDATPSEKTDHNSGIAAYAAISGNTADTVIHETIHQVGFNIGIHSRLGGTPVWVVEGLATVLEPSGMRQKSGRQLLIDRINSERADWFSIRHRPTRTMGSLAKLIASDDYFHQSTLNSYSESWAFTFFLLENSSRRLQFVRYLKTIVERNPRKQYGPKERLADFQDAFGDISRLEVEFIRYLDRM